MQDCHDKAVFSSKNTLFTSKLDLNTRKKLVEWYIWSVVVYGASTVRKEDQKYLGSFEMWSSRRLEKISWTDRVRNEEVFHRTGISCIQ
jgi:hypothetical protein